MTRQTFEFNATTVSPDGTTDEVTISFTYPENRAVCLLGVVDNLGSHADEIKEAIVLQNMTDASMIGLIARLGGAEDDD